MVQDIEFDLAEEIKSRTRLYDYSSGQQTFFEWLAGMLPSAENLNVLELGCGDGTLWQTLLPRWQQCELLLTDISPTILEVARQSLLPFAHNCRSLEFEVSDINKLAYPAKQFDVIIANHNLYYADDVDAVLEQISQLLAPGGRLICSTVGSDHLLELRDRIRGLNPDITWGVEQISGRFGLNNGFAILAKHFALVDQFEYDNRLMVRTVEPIMHYLSKNRRQVVSNWVTRHEDEVRVELETWMVDEGSIRLTPNSGFFIAYC